MFLVTGGKDWRDQYLDNTEILLPGKPWRQAHGHLPRPLASVAVTTLENVVYLFGKIQLTRPYNKCRLKLVSCAAKTPAS